MDGVLFLDFFVLFHQGGIVCLSVGHMQVSSSFDGLIYSFLLYFTPRFTIFAIGQVVLEYRRGVLVLNFYFGGGDTTSVILSQCRLLGVSLCD